MKKHLMIILSVTALSGCTPTMQKWQANHYYDEFTEKTVCRVEMGTQKQRASNRYVFGQYITYNFFAENDNGQVRAGIRTEPAIPINGDVQIKTDRKLYTMTLEDTPLDVKMSTPKMTQENVYTKQMEQTIENIQKYSSPYRAYTGKKAQRLLEDITSTKGEIIFRTVGVNTATSGTGRFIVDENFVTAMKECGITK